MIFRTRVIRVFLVVAGIAACQAILYGPSLAGRKLLATTDVLIASGTLGFDPADHVRQAQNNLLWDQSLMYVPWLDFAAREVRAGRLPLWNPYAFSGSPLLANNASAVFSPFSLPYYLWPDPKALAWIQMLKALVAGLGAYAFLLAIGCSFWASALGACCFPLTGFMIGWQSFPLTAAAVWLPWGFWAIEKMVTRPRGWSGPAFACAIALMQLSGHLEQAAQVSFGIAIYGIWRWIESHGRTPSLSLAIARTALVATLLGAGLGAMQLVPTSQYLQTSHRFHAREERIAEKSVPRPHIELIRLAFPRLLGTWEAGSWPIVQTTFNEGAANGYAGFLMLGLLAPLGVFANWRSTRTWGLITVGVVMAAPLFQFPVLSLWDRAPPFDLMRNSRAIMCTAWVVIVLGAQGLNALPASALAKRSILLPFGILSAGCLSALAWVLFANPPAFWDRIPPESWPWFRVHLSYSAIIAGSGLLAALSWRMLERSPRAMRTVLSGLVLGELLLSARGYNPQVEEETFYPPRTFIEILRQRAGDQRICGMDGVLQPNVAMMYGLRDVRGYDGLDPLPYIELLGATGGLHEPAYAVSLLFSSGPSPILDLLSVRYIVTPRPVSNQWQPVARVNGLYIYENPKALPRAFIPRHVVTVPVAAERLRILGDPRFDPRDLAVVTQRTDLPAAPATGSVMVLSEDPGRVVLRAKARTDAVVVLADAWASGWKATVDGRAVRALQVNHALRGVRIGPGRHDIEWRYSPAAFRIGLVISGLAFLGWVAWLLASFRK